MRYIEGEKMDKKKKSIGLFIIASAIIWGAVILGCSFALKGTECYGEIQNILVGGVFMHIIMIGGVIPLITRRIKNTEK